MAAAMASTSSIPRCQLGRFASTTQPSRNAQATALGNRVALWSSVTKQQQSRDRGNLTVANNGNLGNIERGLLGEDFGARDAFPAELESNFGDKVLGNFNTEHVIKPPDKIKELVGLTAKRCIPCEGGNLQAMDEKEVQRLRNQVPGWKLATTSAGSPCIRQEWKVRSYEAGLELFARIGAVAEEQGHHPDLHLEEDSTTVIAVLTTHAVGGLTENDFIMASKINELDVADLQPKKKARYWA